MPSAGDAPAGPLTTPPPRGDTKTSQETPACVLPPLSPGCSLVLRDAVSRVALNTGCPGHRGLLPRAAGGATMALSCLEMLKDHGCTCPSGEMSPGSQVAWRPDTRGLWASAGWNSDSGFACTSCRSLTSGQATPSLVFRPVKPHATFELLGELTGKPCVKSVLREQVALSLLSLLLLLLGFTVNTHEMLVGK